MNDNNDESYGHFDVLNENDVILNYSDEDLPNYKSVPLMPNNDYIKKKRDSYDETYNSEEKIKYLYSNFTRKCRINVLLCIQCYWPFIVVGGIVALGGWIIYKF
jgi:hypothetical protein